MMAGQAQSSARILGFDNHMILGAVPVLLPDTPQRAPGHQPDFTPLCLCRGPGRWPAPILQRGCCEKSARESHVLCDRATTRVSGNARRQTGERRSMTDDVVAEDQWGQIIFYDQWNTLGLKLRRPAD